MVIAVRRLSAFYVLPWAFESSSKRCRIFAPAFRVEFIFWPWAFSMGFAWFVCESVGFHRALAVKLVSSSSGAFKPGLHPIVEVLHIAELNGTLSSASLNALDFLPESLSWSFSHFVNTTSSVGFLSLLSRYLASFFFRSFWELLALLFLAFPIKINKMLRDVCRGYHHVVLRAIPVEAHQVGRVFPSLKMTNGSSYHVLLDPFVLIAPPDIICCVVACGCYVGQQFPVHIDVSILRILVNSGA